MSDPKASGASVPTTSGASVPTTSIASVPTTTGFDPARAGKRAECDGGGAIAGTRYATREEFTGTLTGEYVDHGDPPWRWYLLKNLERRPDGYPGDGVWCLAENLFVDGEP